MNTLSTGRNFFRGRFLLLLGACLSVYFSYHAIAGQRSILTLLSLQRESAVAAVTLADLSAESNLLHKKVKMLRPDSLDLDYVEELAVYSLGYRRPAAVTVLSHGG